MTKRIIVPLDQSDVAEQALPIARGLSQQLNLPVTLIHVLEVPRSFGHYVKGGDRPPAPREGDTVVPQSPFGRWIGWSNREPTSDEIDRVANDTREAEQYLKAIADTFGNAPVEVAVRYGRPAERILRTAEERENSMIVIASHGRSGLGRAVAGSIASRVVQGASMPVFVVRAEAYESTDATEGSLSKALVPVDGSTFSEQSIPVARRLFGDNRLGIHLVYVIETAYFSNKAEAEGYLEWLSGELSSPERSVSWEVREGEPAEQINRAADEQGVDFIAMTTHGREGLDRFATGSVAERVLNSASRPLMLIRPER